MGKLIFLGLGVGAIVMLCVNAFTGFENPWLMGIGMFFWCTHLGIMLGNGLFHLLCGRR